MPQFAARFLRRLLCFAAILPLVGCADGSTVRPSDFAEWGLLLADVLLAVGGIILAVFGIVGFSLLKRWARAAAEETASKHFEEHLSKEKIRETIKDVLLEESTPYEPDMEPSPNQKAEEGK